MELLAVRGHEAVRRAGVEKTESGKPPGLRSVFSMIGGTAPTSVSRSPTSLVDARRSTTPSGWGCTSAQQGDESGRASTSRAQLRDVAS